MSAIEDTHRRRAFDDPDVARAYAHRAPYPDALIARLAELAPRRGRLLDLGCGPGKLTLPLAGRFDGVDAVDPAQAMIAAAKSLALATNINWIVADAEAAPLAGPYDLITAGASIHWMRLEVLAPRLRPHVAQDGLLAIIAGDEPHQPPWADRWPAFLKRWIELMGGAYDRPAFEAEGETYRAWVDVLGEETFPTTIRQSVEDFIEGEHSRGAWARRKMGAERAAAFDAELRDLLAPHADDGMLIYDVRPKLTYGRLALASFVP